MTLNPASFATDRTEEWRRSTTEDGKTRHETAMVDVVEGDYVIVSYPLLANMLALIGFTRIDNLPDTSDLPGIPE